MAAMSNYLILSFKDASKDGNVSLSLNIGERPQATPTTIKECMDYIVANPIFGEGTLEIKEAYWRRKMVEEII